MNNCYVIMIMIVAIYKGISTIKGGEGMQLKQTIIQIAKLKRLYNTAIEN